MPPPTSIAWLLLVLTGLVTCLALIPRVRRTWRWGRTHTSIPMTAFGAAVVVGTLGLLTVTTFGLLPAPVIFLSLPLLLVGALHDSWRHRRR